jgi:hypothetical protein
LVGVKAVKMSPRPSRPGLASAAEYAIIMRSKLYRR